jgi:Leucine-rich repeat (LRR) protein
MSQYLPNLRFLNLSHSRKLEKIIDFAEFPNLEWLNLEGCINLVELDPSIGLLRKLVYLNLDDCYNLVSIPNNIFDLSSLKYLYMWNCYKAFTTPTRNTYLLPSLRSLYCLREVDISYCHLSQVPDTIECLHWLERLNLKGNDFVTLPSLRKLSKLVYLNLEHCKLLEFLPQLPFSTTMGRERVDRGYLRPTHDPILIGLFIFNCPKLGERKCYSSMTFSWMLQFIKANQRSYFNRIEIVTPGSEIPSWINNQRI